MQVLDARPGFHFSRSTDVIDCNRLEVTERITTEQGAHTTAFDAERQRLYVFLPGSSRAAVYEEA